MVAKSSCNRSVSSSVLRYRNLPFRSLPTQAIGRTSTSFAGGAKADRRLSTHADGLVLGSQSRMGQDVIMRKIPGRRVANKPHLPAVRISYRSVGGLAFRHSGDPTAMYVCLCTALTDRQVKPASQGNVRRGFGPVGLL
jgi:hypothetical protein